jgi:ABC-type antimicrobial peptide transport system permease subunit
MLGLLGIFAASALMRSMVYGVSALNPTYVVVSVGSMIFLTFAAVTIPVLRASQVNPVEALKAE